ncbi:MAG: hypothetical protein HGB00_08375 [Chlorobiaceae bacterium]|nr:hypothetical protein [Chlorobiaceae bacterium]
MRRILSPFYRIFLSSISFLDDPAGGGSGAPAGEKSFSQADVDRIVSERVARATQPFSGIDPKEFARLKDEEQARQQKEAEKKGEYEKIIAQQKTDSDKEIGSLKAQLAAERIDGALVREAAAQSAISPAQVKELLKSHVRTTEAGGIEVLDAEGKPAFREGKPVTVADLVAGFLKENTHFVSANPPGGGADGDKGGKSAPARKIGELDMSKPEDRKYYEEHYRGQERKK